MGSLLLAALLPPAFVSCDAERGAPGMPSDSAYVDLMARLSLIEQELGSEPERADSARRSVFEAHGVSAEALRRYAERHGNDPEHMVGIWRAIEAKVGTLRPEAGDRQLRDPRPSPGEGGREEPRRESPRFRPQANRTVRGRR